jgi:hypothetical protein
MTCLAAAWGCDGILGLGDVRDGDVQAAASGGAAPAASSSGGGSGSVVTTGSGAAGGGGSAASGGAGGVGGAGASWSVVVPTNLASNFDDDDPTFTADRLELFFNSDRGGGYRIWKSKRDMSDLPWEAPTLVTELQSYPSTAPALSPDGLTLWFRYNEDIYRSDRLALGATWSSPPLSVDELNSPAGENPGGMTDDGLTFVLTSSRTGDWDIHIADRSTTSSTWETPVPVAAGATTMHEAGPWISPDGLTLYWHRALSNDPGQQRDLYFSTRNSRADPFGPAQPVNEINSAIDETDLWFHPSLDYGMMAINPPPRTLAELIRR